MRPVKDSSFLGASLFKELSAHSRDLELAIKQIEMDLPEAIDWLFLTRRNAFFDLQDCNRQATGNFVLK